MLLLLLSPAHVAWILIIALLSHRVFNSTAWYGGKFRTAPILLLLVGIMSSITLSQSTYFPPLSALSCVIAEAF